MSEEMVFQISVPTDEEGFVLLECPLCGELFKLNPSDYQDDVIELGLAMAENYANDLIMKELKKFEKKIKGSISFKVSKKPNRKPELPVMLTIEAFEKKIYPCCKKEVKLKPILKMSGSYCPYCGVMDYGFE